jgi:hypothetical protein
VIWTTWRQHRAEAAVGSAILLALTAALLTVGSIGRARARAVGATACAGDCSGPLARLHDDFHSIPPFIAALVAVPLIAGMFWAAPLVSREYETGTQRLAWTQSLSPLRWITTKILLIFGAVAGATLVLGLLTTWALDPLVPAFGGRYNSTWYSVQGMVPVAGVLFALALGVAASALTRRTVPAMAITLLVYAAVQIPMHWIRWRFAPLSTRTLTVPLTSLLSHPTGAPGEAVRSAAPPGAWVHGTTITGPDGHAIPANAGNFGVLRDYCPNLQPDASRNGVLDPAACADRLHGLSLQLSVSYQPRSHFWLMQTVESLVLLGLAATLIACAVLAVSRRPLL